MSRHQQVVCSGSQEILRNHKHGPIASRLFCQGRGSRSIRICCRKNDKSVRVVYPGPDLTSRKRATHYITNFHRDRLITGKKTGGLLLTIPDRYTQKSKVTFYFFRIGLSPFSTSCEILGLISTYCFV